MLMISEWWTEAVDERGGASGVGEDGGPLTESEVRGEDDAALLVAAAHDLEERVNFPIVAGEVADLVDDQEPCSVRAVAQPLVESTGYSRLDLASEASHGEAPRSLPARRRRAGGARRAGRSHRIRAARGVRRAARGSEPSAAGGPRRRCRARARRRYRPVRGTCQREMRQRAAEITDAPPLSVKPPAAC